MLFQLGLCPPDSLSSLVGGESFVLEFLLDVINPCRVLGLHGVLNLLGQERSNFLAGEIAANVTLDFHRSLGLGTNALGLG